MVLTTGDAGSTTVTIFPSPASRLASSAMPEPFPYWRALDAMHDWCEEHGRPPPEAEWARATLDRPAARTVRRRWGWYPLIADALGISVDKLLGLWGQPGYRSQRPVIPHWRNDAALQAMIGHKRSHRPVAEPEVLGGGHGRAPRGTHLRAPVRQLGARDRGGEGAAARTETHGRLGRPAEERRSIEGAAGTPLARARSRGARPVQDR